MSPLGGVRGAEPDGQSGRWGVMDVFGGLPFQPITAFGGTVYDSEVGGVTYRFHEFASTGSSTFVVADLGKTDGSVDYIIVGGGGGGGAGSGGGGGAGGVLTTFGASPFTVSTTSYTITVGAGGSNATSRGTTPTNGQNSSAFGQTAIGGGHGAADPGNFNYNPQSGGSGGGGAYWSTAGTQRNGASGTPGQGNAGGNAFTLSGNGAGGGGFGAIGSPNPNGAGGAGFDATSFVPTLLGDGGWFAGGGGGACGGAGGQGGGGSGGSSDGGVQVAGNGLANTGSGGGAGCLHSGSISGNGGSGIVIIRYPLQRV